MTEKQKNILKYILLGSIPLNMVMCLNLYRQMLEIQYKVHAIDSNVMSSIEYISKDVWDIKKSYAKPAGEFE